MKAIEAGYALPDAEVAHANAARTRARALGLIGFCVPLVMAGAALGGTVIVLMYREEPGMAHVLLPLLCTVWGVTGIVSLVVPLACAGSMERRHIPHEDRATKRPAFAQHV
jgi:hypothetical protein